MAEPAEDRARQGEMLNKIAELTHSNSHLKDLNASMMQWLEAAEAEIAALNSDNKSLRKQVDVVERVDVDAEEDGGEPCPIFSDEKRKNEQTIKKMEEQLNLMGDHNEQLTSELKDLQQGRERDMNTLSKISEAQQFLQRDLEEAQHELQQKVKVIEEKNQLLRNAEETLEEFSNTIKDLRMTSHELKLQLEERQDESSFAFLNELVEDKINGFPSSGVSYAEEVTQLGPTVIETKDAEVLVDPRSFSADFQQQYDSSHRCWWERIPGKAIHAAFLGLLFAFFFSTLMFVAMSYVGNVDSLSLQLAQSYCNVHFVAVPPF